MHETNRVTPGVPKFEVELRGDFLEVQRPDLADVGVPGSAEAPAVRPLDPQRGLRQPPPLGDRVPIARHRQVLQAAAAEEVHPRRVGDLAGVEDHVARADRRGRAARVAHLPHDEGALLEVPLEKGMLHQVRAEQLEMQLHLERLRDYVQQLHVILGHVLLNFLQRKARVPLNPDREPRADVVVRQKTPEDGHLLRVLVGDDLQARDLGSQAGDAHSREHKAGEEEEDRVHAFHQVVGDDLVHAPGKLREGPVQADPVAVHDARVPVQMLEHPSVVVRLPNANPIPRTSRKMCDGYNNEDDLDYVSENHQPVRPNPLVDELDDLLDAQEPHQSQHPEDPHAARRLAQAGESDAFSSVLPHKLAPINGYQENVQGEPRPDVAPQDLGRPHLHRAVRVEVAREQGRGHVEGPEEARHPYHHVRENCILRVEKLEGDHQHVVE
mmetsp:Transcript_54709/g.166241  ORF Transcript_54709/g.166241 Transcript_54709/m.166241 type:complete len:440 (+) Transcript_54709:92-1411(+)